ncbi:MAG: META domain-containing protein [Caldilinea sp. CFX5]|nr:META domain-containing protein [Caldilinea sp. CFX5]
MVKYGLLLAMLAAIATACLQPMSWIPLPEQFSLFQAESPLVSEEMLLLTKNPWRVVTIIHQNEMVAFDAIQPIYVKIWPDGISAETSCNNLGFGIIAQDEHQYQLGEGVSTEAGCPEVQTKQYSGFWTALSNTNRFELQNEQLTLIGDESQIVLEAAHPFSLAEPVFTQNRWQLIEITHQGQPIIFDAIRPVYLEITGDGYLHFKTEQCNIATFRMDIKSEEYYRFEMSADTSYECPQITNSQISAIFSNVFLAVSETNTLKLNGTQLLLTGPETRVVLEGSPIQ